MDEKRLKHSLAVARKMVEIAKNKGMSEEEINNCFIIGFNHDIGYEYTKNGFNHNKVGGELLRKSGFKFWKEVYYHGIVTDEYESIYLNIKPDEDLLPDQLQLLNEKFPDEDKSTLKLFPNKIK